jgi:hypothetical protein
MGGIDCASGFQCERKHKLPEVSPSERCAWWAPIINTFGSLLLHAIVLLAYMWQRIAQNLQSATKSQKAKAASHHTGPSVAFSGCAFWWPYHAGVCQYLFEEFDLSDVRVYSTSASTFPVVCTVVGVNPLTWCVEDYPKCLAHWWSRPFSCFVDSTDFLRRLWHSFLPKDAYKRVEGHLVVSVTNVGFNSAGLPVLTNEQASSFQSNDDLVNALMATINVPGVFFRGFPKWRGRLCVDGAYSEQAHNAGGKTVVINLAPGASSDIRPSRRLPWSWLLFPQPMQQTRQMMNWGYEDARTNRALFESKGWRPKKAVQ